MRLLFFTNVFPNPWQPTKGSFNFAMALALAKQHAVQVVSPVAWVDAWNGSAPGETDENRRCPKLDLDGLDVHYPRYYYPPKVLRTGYGWFLWHSVRNTVLQSLRQHRPHAVLSYWAHPDGAVALRAARLAGVPAIVMVGGSDVLLLTSHSGRRRRIVDVLSGADAVVTVSRHLRLKVLSLGVPPEKVHVVYRGVDRVLFSPGDRAASRRQLGIPQDVQVILWVGRMVPVKGLDVLLEACTQLKQKPDAPRVYFVGDGPLRQPLDAKCRCLGLENMISFAGVVSHTDLPAWYRAADLTVLPSRSEGVPNVLLESLSCGTPFVASGVGGVPEICDEGRDRLVAADDPTALARALRKALAQADTIARPTFVPPSWETSAGSLVQVIESLLSGAATRPFASAYDVRPRVSSI